MPVFHADADTRLRFVRVRSFCKCGGHVPAVYFLRPCKCYSWLGFQPLLFNRLLEHSIHLAVKRRGYENIRLTCRVKSDAPREKVVELCNYVQKTSPVLDIIRNPVPVMVALEG